MKNINLIFGAMFLLVLTFSFVSADSISNIQLSTPGATSFSQSYDGGVDLFPSFNEDMCQEGTDFILQISPLGCTPSVVRSDLLEEQNVPVFCPLSATKINPLIKVEAIDSIAFSAGDFPDEVSGVGFHPANAAFRGNSQALLNSPILENVGYAVIVLKKQQNESDMPDWVEGTLSANIRYDVERAFGVGTPTFYVPEIIDDKTWEQNYKNYGFWNGKGYLRTESVEDDVATIGIYSDKFNKISSVRIEKGETSRSVYLPGFYCTAGAQIRLNKVEDPDTHARISISGRGIVDVVEDTWFLDNKCKLTDLKKSGLVQRVEGFCNTDNGKEDFVFSINPKVNVKVDGKEKVLAIGDLLDDYSAEKDKKIYLGYVGMKGDEPFIVPVVSTATTSAEFLQRDIYSSLPGYVSVYQFETGFAPANFLASIVKFSYGTIFTFKNALISGDYPIGGYYLGKGSESLDLYLDFSGGVTGFVDRPLSKPEIEFVDYSGAVDRAMSKEFKENFDNSMQDYRRVIDSFPDTTLTPSDQDTFGELAYLEAINLAKEMDQRETNMKLCNEFKSRYPDKESKIYDLCLDVYAASSEGSLTKGFLVEGSNRVLTFEGINEPSLDEYRAEIIVDGAGEYGGVKVLQKNKPVYISDKEFITLKDMESDYIVLDVSAVNHGKIEYVYDKQSLKIGVGDKKLVGETKYGITVKDINLKKMAQVSVIPDIKNKGTSTNFTFKIGIEKRAIQLSPKQIEDQIKKTDKMIEQWEDISNQLGSVVKGLKTACLGTGLFLTAKNFLTNLDGQSIARKEVMRTDGGWTDICRDQVGEEDKYEFKSMDACYLHYSDEIDNDVELVNDVIENQKPITYENCGERYGEILGNFNGLAIEGDYLTNQDIRGSFSQEGCEQNILTLSQAKDLERYQEILKNNPSPQMRSMASNKIGIILSDVDANSQDLVLFTSIKSDLSSSGLNLGITSYGNKDAVRGVYSGGTILGSKIAGAGLESNKKYPVEIITYNSEKYVVILEHSSGAHYVPEIVYEFESISGGVIQIGAEAEDIKKKFSEFVKYDGSSYENPIKDYNKLQLLKYFETSPYKGLPAVVPFDVQDGWYVRSKQIVSGFGNIGAYDDSGQPASFEVCNVGFNGKLEAETGYGDDICRVFNPGTGQIYGTFPGLNTGETEKIVGEAIDAIQQAQRQYKSEVKSVNINGVSFKVGTPAVDIPDIQCQDVMSPDDCYLLFNVCDPVICPSSRCDFGGTYPVSNVIQSGIIGSILLCLPNVQEGIIMPVCLTGVHAGIDGIVSIMQNYRDCLQESSETGQMTGVCDEIYSIYLCEFFWRQSLPIAEIFLPKAFEAVLGQGGRGGGEYLGVQDAYDTAEQSINYMAGYYGSESYEAFKVRATDQVEAAVCKNSISGTFPTTADLLDSLVEPDSPSQYHAWFHETTFTTATVPATSQYKVFYHVFAGKDQGASYNVYLKSPEGGSYYNVNPTFTVASGYINRGDYASETKDFTAPTGYQELCISVNGQDECGFKQVSTSFVSEYASKMYMDEQASATDITSQSDCVSGTASVYSLLQPNVQAGVDEVVNPELYNHGIVRVCSTEDPGLGTDNLAGTQSSRWAQVGSCDEGRGNLKCWLDTSSVKNAIDNTFIAGQTLDEVRKNQLESIKKSLEGEGGTVEDDEIRKIRDMSDSDRIGFIDENLLLRAVYNYQKAQLLIYRAQAFGNIARYFYENPPVAADVIPEKIFEYGIESSNLPERLDTIDFDVSEIVFEFQDGTIRNNLFLKYDKDVWKWGWDEDGDFRTLNNLDEDYSEIGGGLERRTFNEGLYFLMSHIDSDRNDSGWVEVKPEESMLASARSWINSVPSRMYNSVTDYIFTSDEKLSSEKVEYFGDNYFMLNIGSGFFAEFTDAAPENMFFKFENGLWYWSFDTIQKEDKVWMNSYETKVRGGIYQGQGISSEVDLLNILDLLNEMSFIDGAIVLFSTNVEKWEDSFGELSEDAGERVLEVIDSIKGDLVTEYGCSADVNCYLGVIKVYELAGVNIQGKEYCFFSDGHSPLDVQNYVSSEDGLSYHPIAAEHGSCDSCGCGDRVEVVASLQPGDMLQFVHNVNDEKTGWIEHNVIFVGWLDEDKRIASVFHRWWNDERTDYIFKFGKYDFSENSDYQLTQAWRPKSKRVSSDASLKEVYDKDELDSVSKEIYDKYKTEANKLTVKTVKMIMKYASEYDVPPHIAMAVAKQESALTFDPKVMGDYDKKSKTYKALSIYQIHQDWRFKECQQKGIAFVGEDFGDIQEDLREKGDSSRYYDDVIECGISYLSENYNDAPKCKGNWEKAICGYNRGPANCAVEGLCFNSITKTDYVTDILSKCGDDCFKDWKN
jgi:transglycosylase-like protein with SLT domain